MKPLQYKMKVKFFTAIAAGSLLAGCGADLNFKQGPLKDSNNNSLNEPVLDDFVDETFDAPFPVPNSVDILFVDDNSGSMTPDQENMARKFQGFINELVDVDWQIGITTTDVTSSGVDGLLLPFSSNNYILKPGPQAQSLFERTIQRSEVGSGSERPIIAAAHSVRKRMQNNNIGFFRDNAALAVVALSDEDENSDAHGRNGKPVPAGQVPWVQEDEPQSLVDTIESVFPDKSFTFNAIDIVPGDIACLREQLAQTGGQGTGYYGYVHREAADLTGGVVGSICDANFSSTVAKIGQNIKQQLTSFKLKYAPEEPENVVVEITPMDPQLTWKISGNKIYFNKALARGTKVHVKYKKPSHTKGKKSVKSLPEPVPEASPTYPPQF